MLLNTIVDMLVAHHLTFRGSGYDAVAVRQEAPAGILGDY